MTFSILQKQAIIIQNSFSRLMYKQQNIDKKHVTKFWASINYHVRKDVHTGSRNRWIKQYLFRYCIITKPFFNTSKTSM